MSEQHIQGVLFPQDDSDSRSDVELRQNGLLRCQLCRRLCSYRSTRQKYCELCSAERSRERNRNWARVNPPSKEQSEKAKRRMQSRKEAAEEVGKLVSRDLRLGIDWISDEGFLWSRRVSVPFTWSASKNAVCSLAQGGH